MGSSSLNMRLRDAGVWLCSGLRLPDIFECWSVPACLQLSDLKVLLGVSNVGVCLIIQGLSRGGGGSTRFAPGGSECVCFTNLLWPHMPRLTLSPREAPVSPGPGRPRSRPLWTPRDISFSPAHALAISAHLEGSSPHPSLPGVFSYLSFIYS